MFAEPSQLVLGGLQFATGPKKSRQIGIDCARLADERRWYPWHVKGDAVGWSCGRLTSVGFMSSGCCDIAVQIFGRGMTDPDVAFHETENLQIHHDTPDFVGAYCWKVYVVCW